MGRISDNPQQLPSALARWLLEVNASPSLTASSQEDYELKTCLLEDTLHVVDMEARWGPVIYALSMANGLLSRER